MSTVDNGFNPLWFEQCEFDVINPEVALIRFVVQDEDMFSEANFLGQATYPVRCLRPGFRSIQLKNGFGEDLELATLLVLIDLKNPMVSQSGSRMLHHHQHILPIFLI